MADTSSAPNDGTNLSEQEVTRLDNEMEGADQQDDGPVTWMNQPMEKPRQLACGEGLCSMRINPFVFFVSITVIWAFIIWAAVDPEGARLETSEWDSYITNHFSWLYIFSVNVFLFLSIFLVFSKFGDIRLAKSPDEPPDFTYASWFAMLFSAGIGIGLFFYGVGEPLFHYSHPNRYNHQYMQMCTNVNTTGSCFTAESRVERALWAMNISWYHWGFGASCCYVVVGLPIALYSYKYGQPMTMRTALYPMLGNRTNGWFGDIVEICSIIGTLYGVCTSLGLGVTQIAGGLKRVFNDVDKDDLGVKLAIIWCITAIATVSVVTGLEVGIRRISEVNFLLGLFILMMVFFLSEWYYILDFGVSEIGIHLNYMLSLSFASDGIAKVIPFSSQDIQKTCGFDFAYDASDVEQFMAGWTVFYWAWWISWSPFVGLFIARISKGRTIREFILGNMFVPTLVTSIWLLIFGGAGMYFEFQAENEGMTCDDCTANPDYAAGIAGCKMLSCRGWSSDMMLFDLLELLPLTDFMSIVTTLGICLYFVTSSDSASAVIDQIAANGDQHGPTWQRVFWAVTEGLTATVILAATDGENSSLGLKALRSISIISAFPFCILMLLMAVTFMKFLKMTTDPEIAKQYTKKREFSTGIIDAGPEVIVTCGNGNPLNVISCCCAPAIMQIDNVRNTGGSVIVWALALFIPLICLWVFAIMDAADVDGANGLMGVCWVVFWATGLALRMRVREHLNVNGSFLSDLCTWMWCGPCAAFQETIALKGHTRRYRDPQGLGQEKARPEDGVYDGDQAL